MGIAETSHQQLSLHIRRPPCNSAECRVLQDRDLTVSGRFRYSQVSFPAPNPRTSRAIARSLVLIRELMTTGEISGKNALARIRRFPSVSNPRLRCASMIVFIVPIICGMIWNTDVTMKPKRGENPRFSSSSTNSDGLVERTNTAKDSSMFSGMFKPIWRA